MFGSWVSKVLCLIPDSFSSLDLSRKRTWCIHEKLLRSCSYPCRHWSALNTPCYLCGWASSLSATDLLLLLEEELVHHCHHVSVQINKMFVCCCVLSVQPLLSCAVSGTSAVGNVQVWGLMYGEHGRTRSKHGCTSEHEWAVASLQLGLDIGDRHRVHLKPICYDSSSFQNHTTAKKDEKPKVDSFQDPKKVGKKVKTMSF